MKEFILINYNLNIDKIYNDIFFIEDEKIKIIKMKDISKIEKLFLLSNDMYRNKIMIDTFILNKNNGYYTKKNNEYILLLKINENDEYIDLNEILKYSNNINSLEKYDILEKYKNRIDKFEENINKYVDIEDVNKTANYYIGMAENAISILNEYKDESNDLGHEINLYEFSKKELNNPFNFIKINKLYNISNYLKYKFITNRFDYNELDLVIKNMKTEKEEGLFFAYMLYPNYYFDIFDKEIELKKLKKVIKNNEKYINVLRYIKENTKKCEKIKLFIWIN